MYANNNQKDTAFDTEIPSFSDKSSMQHHLEEEETDRVLLVYSEQDVKVRVRKNVWKTIGIFLFLAVVAMSAALIHGRVRKEPDEAMLVIAQEQQKASEQELAAGQEEGNVGGENHQNRQLDSHYCYEYTQITADYDLYVAAEYCIDNLYWAGCYGGTPYYVDYYQLVYGGYWYVECICDC